MWLSYELTGRQVFYQAACQQSQSFSRRLATGCDLQHHDIGFLYLLSHVAAVQIAGLPESGATTMAAAERLLARYLPGAGILQAWGALDDPQEQGRAIVDGLMNLPLLHWASTTSGDPRYRDAARSHARRTREQLVRADGSTHHTYFFDPLTGRPLRSATHQGWSDSSCWARGQAWALYGFSLNHRHLPELDLLATSCQIADYFLDHLPSDQIALWDLSLPLNSSEPRDSSASAIAACGLFDLAEQLPPGARRQHYHDAALRLAQALEQHCAARRPQAGGLLLHGTYHRQAELGVDECNLWGDYYYLEALARRDYGWQSYDRTGRQPISMTAIAQ